MPGEKVVILVPWSVHLREKIKHKIKVKIKQGKRMRTASVKKGEKKNWHLRSVCYVPKTMPGMYTYYF